MKLEDLAPGLSVAGLVPGDSITVVAAQWHGADAVELTYKTTAGSLAQRVLYRTEQDTLSIVAAGGRPFDAPASDFKLVAEMQRIKLAGLFDPMLAVATSDVQPLPHQIRAVYGELLPRTPLRFLLADDPGAGKTIMAALYISRPNWAPSDNPRGLSPVELAALRRFSLPDPTSLRTQSKIKIRADAVSEIESASCVRLGKMASH